MAYQVPAHKKSIGQNKFDFGPRTGTEYSVRKVNLLTMGELEELDDGVKALDFFGPKGTEQGKYVRSLDRAQFKQLVAAWHADSDVTPGE